MAAKKAGTVSPQIRAKARAVLAFAEQQAGTTANWVELSNVLFGLGGKATVAFPTERERTAFCNKFPAVSLAEQEVREKRGLIEHRQKLVGRRVTLQNRVRAILVGQGLAAPCGAKAWSASGLAGIAAHARPLAECGPLELWQGRLHLTLNELEHVQGLLEQAEKKLDAMAKTNEAMKILDTIPGVGPRTAEAVAAFLPESKQFRTSKQVSAYGGLVPRQYQSSETDHRGRITKRGPRTLRKLLVECAWVMLRYNRWARAVYQRLTHSGKTRKKQALVALARKLLVHCWAMLRDGTVWRGEPEPVEATPP